MDPRSDPTPLYFRIQRDLREEIVSGRLPPGTPLPTEQELRESYGVSRITVIKALNGLRAGGLIVSRRGVGGFVAGRPAPTKSLRLLGSLDEALAPAPDLRRTVLSSGELADSASLANSAYQLLSSWKSTVARRWSNGPGSGDVERLGGRSQAAMCGSGSSRNWGSETR